MEFECFEYIYRIPLLNYISRIGGITFILTVCGYCGYTCIWVEICDRKIFTRILVGGEFVTYLTFILLFSPLLVNGGYV